MPRAGACQAASPAACCGRPEAGRAGPRRRAPKPGNGRIVAGIPDPAGFGRYHAVFRSLASSVTTSSPGRYLSWALSSIKSRCCSRAARAFALSIPTSNATAGMRTVRGQSQQLPAKECNEHSRPFRRGPRNLPARIGDASEFKHDRLPLDASSKTGSPAHVNPARSP
jgi:hypothetical protein